MVCARMLCVAAAGFIYEQGPFLFKMQDGQVQLRDNPWAWNKMATMVFLDSPSGDCHTCLHMSKWPVWCLVINRGLVAY